MKIFISNKFMRAIFYLFFFSIINLFIVSYTNNNPIINSTARDAQGDLIKISDYRGKWILVNYWASWCEHCQAEIPQLDAFYQAHHDKDAVVLAVDIDQTDNKNLPLVIKQLNIDYPVLDFPGPDIGVSQIQGVPTSFLINPKGQLVKAVFGELTKQTLEQEMGLPSVG